ncbi:enhancer of mRNA decapping [Basidiobolus ranarum]|uniref:Enhancer of mRNA-decapping protein 3 n=1 Tax=Basidiobolus ranarum TaxID=34480 RepID=A0ABR2W8H1_9FUNG
MAEAFIGLRVKVSLADNFILEGLVSSIDQQTQYLTLTNVLTFSNGIQQHLPSYGVAGPDIKDLQILPSQAPPPQPQHHMHSQPQPSVQKMLPQKSMPNKNPAPMPHNGYPSNTNSYPIVNGTQYSPQELVANSQATVNATKQNLQPHIQAYNTSSQATASKSQEHRQRQQQQQQQISPQMPPRYQQEVTQSAKYQEPVSTSPNYPKASKGYINTAPAQPKAPYVDPAIVSFTQPTSTTTILPRHQQTHRPSHGLKNSRQADFVESRTSPFIPPPSIELSVNDKVDICLDYETLRSDTESQLINDSDALDSDQPHIVHGGHKNRKLKPKSVKQRAPQSPGPKNSRYPRSPGKNMNGWANENVNDFKKQEFDFQHNLGLFDKKKVFAEIKESDSTDPDGLLVNINRNTGYKPGRPVPQNYGPLENVLERSRKQKYYEDDDDELDEEDNETTNEESDLENWKKNQEPIVTIRTLTGITCPFVTKAQMGEIEKIAATETGPSEDQIIENAGRSTAIMCLKALGGSRRIQPNNHNDAPLVVILAGNTKTGAYGLSAARHLTNHGCEVIICVAGKERDIIKSVSVQSKYLRASGGKIVKSAAELPEAYTAPVDLIVDALLGYQPSARDSDHDYDLASISDLIDWANDNKAPVLSLDMPSGFKGQFKSGNAIHPKWTLCLGAPRYGLKSRNMTGEIFLADIGIPRILYKKVGVRGWKMPWGADYLIGLEYA